MTYSKRRQKGLKVSQLDFPLQHEVNNPNEACLTIRQNKFDDEDKIASSFFYKYDEDKIVRYRPGWFDDGGKAIDSDTQGKYAQ